MKRSKINRIIVKVLLAFGCISVALFAQRYIANTVFSQKAPVRKNIKQELKIDSPEASVLTVSDVDNFKNHDVRSIVPAVGTDLGAEIEPNDTFMTATNLPGSEVKIRGDIFGNGDLDWFRFTAAAGDRVYAAVMTSYSSSASTDSELRLFASDGTTLIEFDQDDGVLGGLSSTIAGATIAAPGTYYLQVKHFSATNTLRPYEMYLSVESGAPTPEVEANDTPATANPLPPSGWVSGARNPAVATEQDWYSFTANAGDTVYLSLDLDPERDVTTWNGRLGMALLGDANNQMVVVDDAGTGDTIDSEAFFMTVKTAGTYYAFVDSATAATGGPTATYNLSVTVIPKANVGINCTTYTSTNVPLPINDGLLTSSTITVPATMGRIASTKVSINATHALMQDMDVNLRSPGNNNNGLFNDIGSAAVGGQTMMDLTLDQYSSGVTPIFTVLRPMVFKPELNYRLDWYDGENPSGVWTLDIRDDLANNNIGTLTAWSLEICEQPPVAGSVIYTENFEANNGGYTLGTVGQLANEWEYGTPATLATTTTSPVADIIGCNSGTNCWKTDLDNTYDISSNQDLVSPNITLPNQNGTATLTWAMRYQMESATFDRARVTINEVGGMGLSRTVWQWTGATMTTTVGVPTAVNGIGNSAGWGIYRAKIDDFANFAGRTINITFHVDSETSINFAGMAIDDVQLRFVPVVAANVGVGGRALTTNGSGISRVQVTLTGPNGFTRSAITNMFGYYHFDNVEVGQNYVLSAGGKEHQFNPVIVSVSDEITNANIIAVE
jgi:subtilisin-like proprotein convertase family protein